VTAGSQDRVFDLDATMSEESPPQTVLRVTHTIRPHHIDLLAITLLVFKEFEFRPLPSEFRLYIYRLLLNEMSEVRVRCRATISLHTTDTSLGCQTKDACAAGKRT
jgi:hypothetical protein